MNRSHTSLLSLLAQKMLDLVLMEVVSRIYISKPITKVFILVLPDRRQLQACLYIGRSRLDRSVELHTTAFR